MPMYKIFEILESKLSSIEKDRRSIREINTWTNNSDRNDFIQTLKNHSELFVSKLKKANGLNNIKICIIIYLREYVNTRFINPKLIKDFIIPSNENIFNSSPDV